MRENSAFSLKQEAPDGEKIHFRAQEAIERLFRPADDGFVLIERGVEHERDARLKVESGN